MKHDPDCIFCKIVAGEIPCHKIYEDEYVLSFLDIGPIVPGHSLVVPKGHFENLFEMPDDALSAVHRASRKIGEVLRRELQRPGLAVLQLNGREANQVVMHYHVHLIPRDKSKDGLNTFDWESTPGNMEEIGNLAGKIRSAMGA